MIAIGCVTEFGFTGGRDPAADLQAYRLALGVGVAAGVIQILFGLFRAGILGEILPQRGRARTAGLDRHHHHRQAVSHHDGFGIGGQAPLELLARIPQFIVDMNPVIGLIGIISLIIMFTYPLIKNPRIKVIPAPMVVLLVTVPLGMYFNLSQPHTYSFSGREYNLGPEFPCQRSGEPVQRGDVSGFLWSIHR